MINTKPPRPFEQRAKDILTGMVITKLVQALSEINPQDITPHLMTLLAELKQNLNKKEFNKLLDELLVTIVLLKKGA